MLNKHAPLRKKFLKANHAPYLTKSLRKAIMLRSQLETKYLKTKTQTDLKLYKKHKNFRSKLYKRERRKYYESLDRKNALDSKEFRKTMRPFLSDKNTVFLQISIEKNERIYLMILICLKGLALSLKILFKTDEYYLSDTENLSDPVEIAIRKFENHPSAQATEQNISVKQDFYFSNTEVSGILKETTALNNKKNGIFGNIPTKRLKEVSDIYAPVLNDIWNNEIITQKRFPNNLKLADVTPVLKKEDASLLKNYRPVSVLQVVSKIYERIMQKQILEYIDKHLSPHLCGYRKGYSTQTALMFMLEKWKLSIDNKDIAGGVLMDLSKAFDTINHPLLLAKLHAYGFSKQALAVICSYLSNRKQRIKINNVFSSWKNLILGMPQ